MNMPLDEQGQVNFTTTLFALIREDLCIKMRPAGEMDVADKELRVTIQRIWPIQSGKVLDYLIPPRPDVIEPGTRMSVGKIYAGFLIAENWKANKFGKDKLATIPDLQHGDLVQDSGAGGSSPPYLGRFEGGDIDGDSTQDISFEDDRMRCK